MKLWLISQGENSNYDTFDSAVVAAESEEEAKLIHPSGGVYGSEKGKRIWEGSEWARSPEYVSAKCVGEATSNYESGDVICASYNAG